MSKSKTGAEDIRYDLTDLYVGLDDPQLEKDMQANQEAAAAFAGRYHGQIASLGAEELAEAMAAFEAVITQLINIEEFIYLTWCMDTQNPEASKWLARSQEHGAGIKQTLIFFEIEWCHAPEETAALAKLPPLARYSHYLNLKRRETPYMRSEPEEKILSQMAITGNAGWVRYFEELTSHWTYNVDGQELTLDQTLKLQFQPDRSLRQKSAEAITKVLSQNSHATTYIFNMILQDKASVDRIRGYPSWISKMNLSNEISETAAEALVTAVTSRYDIVARYYRLLQQQLGYEELHLYDRYVSLDKQETFVPWAEARRMVLSSFAAFDQQFSDIARKFFDQRWIDAPPIKGKLSGAFCAGLGVTSHAFVHLNYTGRREDVMTLAHELGHGIHFELSRGQSQLHTGSSRFHILPLTIAETASTFGEMLLFDHLLGLQDDPQVRLAMRMEKMLGTLLTVFRQTAMNRFEDKLHNGRRTAGELSTAQISDLWMETQNEQYQQSVNLGDDYRLWWSYIPHFLFLPGYVYSYAFGELLVWSLYAIYQNQPEGFAGRFIDVLRAGSSDWPHHLFEPLGVDLQDPGFWHQGLGLLDEFIYNMEQDAAALNGPAQ